MKCLSLNQPWASLIALGVKKIETRSWKTNYRGKLAIHASAKFTNEMKRLCTVEPFRNALIEGGYGSGPEFLPCGFVIATCDLVDCVVIPTFKKYYALGKPGKWLWGLPPDQPELSFGDYTPGRYAWRLENVKIFSRIIPAKGKLGLWEWAGG
jgi:hypothetical protein